MSTLQERRALCLLAVAHGAVISIGENYDLGPAFAAKVEGLCLLLKKAGKQWPIVAGTDADVPAWVVSKLRQWAPDAAVTSILALASLSLHVLTDLDELAEKKLRQTHQRKYRKQAELLAPCIAGLAEIIDELGARHEVCADTDRLLKKLYLLMGG
jgi:hypothetical protein